MVASVAAFVDAYRPKYAILENVPAMAENSLRNPNENVFSQILATFVAMGYQASQYLLDSWSIGNLQCRSRLFISIAAPGLKPIPRPMSTHSHPAGVFNKKLGPATNGLLASVLYAP